VAAAIASVGVAAAAAVGPPAPQRRAPSTPSRRGARASRAGGASQAAAPIRPAALATRGATARSTRSRSCARPAVQPCRPPGDLAVAARMRAGTFLPRGAARAVLHGSTLPSRLRRACGWLPLAASGGSRQRQGQRLAGSGGPGRAGDRRSGNWLPAGRCQDRGARDWEWLPGNGRMSASRGRRFRRSRTYPSLARVGHAILVRAVFRVCVLRWERRCHGLSG
jgi:hypothetical protein